MLTTDYKLKAGASFPPVPEARRQKDAARYTNLYKGEFARVWPETRTADGLSLRMNWFNRITEFWVECLFGATPQIRGVDLSNSSVNALVEAAQEAQRDLHRYGNGVLMLHQTGGSVEIKAIRPYNWFPIHEATAPHRLVGHLLAFPFRVDDKRDAGLGVPEGLGFPYNTGTSAPTANRVRFLVIAQNGGVVEEVYRLAGTTLNEQLSTKVLENQSIRIQALYNGTDADGYGTSGYAHIEDSVRQIAVLNINLAKVFERHANPHIYIDERVEGLDSANIKDGLIIPVPEGGKTPGYMTWEPHLQWQYEQIEALTQFILNSSGLPDIIFSTSRASGIALSGAAFALRSMPMQFRIDTYRRQWERAFEGLLIDYVGDNALDIIWPNLGLFNMIEQVATEEARVAAGLGTREDSATRLDRGGVQNLPPAPAVAPTPNDGGGRGAT